MSIVTEQQQSEVNECASEYTRLVQERADRLEKLIMVAIMELSLGHVHRAQEVLNQAITS